MNTIAHSLDFRTPPRNTGVLSPAPAPSHPDLFPSGVQIPTLGWITFTCNLRTALLPSPSDPEPRIIYEPSELRQAFRDYWSQLTSDTWRDRCPGLNYYDYTWRSALGLAICYSDDRQDWSCRIPQTALAALTLQQQQDLLWVISDNFYGKFTRLDLTVTDTTGVVTKQLLKSAWDADNMNRRSTESDWIENKSGGWTLQLGSRKSETFMRIYDKHSEQLKKGNATYPQNAIQFELELKGVQANSQLPLLLNTPVSDWNKLFKSFYRATCDFIDRSSNSKIERCSLLGWWLEFIEDSDKNRLPRIKVQPTVEKVLDWLQTGVGSTLSFLAQYYNKETVFSMIDCLVHEYSDKLNDKQRFLLQRLQPTC